MRTRVGYRGGFSRIFSDGAGGASKSTARAVDLGLPPPLPGRSGALDAGERRDAVRVGRYGLAGRHRAAAGLVADDRAGAVLHDLGQQLVRMVPRVAGRVVRRRRQQSVGIARAPVGLAFELDAVAALGAAAVDGLAAGDGREIARGHLRCRTVRPLPPTGDRAPCGRRDRRRDAREQTARARRARRSARPDPIAARGSVSTPDTDALRTFMQETFGVRGQPDHRGRRL